VRYKGVPIVRRQRNIVKEKKIEDTRARARTHTRLHSKSERRRRKEVGETRWIGGECEGRV